MLIVFIVMMLYNYSPKSVSDVAIQFPVVLPLIIQVYLYFQSDSFRKAVRL